MSAPVRTDPELDIGAPRVLFRWPDAVSLARQWDVALDGERFVMLRRLDEAGTRVKVVLNWFDELERLVPTEH